MSGSGDASERLEATVRGRVQGVGFRVYIARAARALDLRGWVANRRDGAVAVVAEGDGGALDELEAMLATGPRGASVSGVTSQRGPARGDLPHFEIRHGDHPGD